MVFKSLNDLAHENLGNNFSKLSDVHTRILRNNKCNLAVPRFVEQIHGINSTRKLN